MRLAGRDRLAATAAPESIPSWMSLPASAYATLYLLNAEASKVVDAPGSSPARGRRRRRMSAGRSKISCSHGMHSIIGAGGMPGPEVLVDPHHVRVVGHDGDMVGERQLRDREPFGDAAEAGDVGLDVADAGSLDEVAKRDA